MSLLSASKVLILLGITSSVNAQRGSRFPFGSKGESPEESEITVWGFLLLINIVLCFLTFTCLIIVRGHRLPYAALLSMLIAFIVSEVANLVERGLMNTSPSDLAQHTASTLNGLNQFFGYWSQILLFTTIVLAIHDRIRFIDTGSGKTPSKNDTNIRLIFWVVHGLFVLLMFIFGSAAAATAVSIDRDIESHNNISFSDIVFMGEEVVVGGWEASVPDGLYYTFASFVIFTAFDVVALAVYLRSRLTKESGEDRVSSSLIYFVTPCYILLTILFMTFLILFSHVGVTHSSSILTRVRIAKAITMNIVQMLLISPIILYGLLRMGWENPELRIGAFVYRLRERSQIQGQAHMLAPQAPPVQISQSQVPQANVQ